jgi:hypothetical protein
MTERRRLTKPPAPLSASDILDLAVQANKDKPRVINPGDFKPGNKAHVGRKLRGPNRNTAIMREAVILAMRDAAKGLMTKRGLPYSGVVDYLSWCATKEPAAFLSFVAKAVLPVQIKHDMTMDQVVEVRFKHIEDVKAEFARRGLPLPQSTFLLEHHASIEDAVASLPADHAAPATVAQPAAPPVRQAAPAQAEVLPPAKSRSIPAHLERYARPPTLYRELIEEAQTCERTPSA